MFARSLGELRSAQHSRHFFCALLAGYGADPSTRAPARFLLLDDIVLIAKRCNLWQMRHAQNLMRPRESFELLAHSLRRSSANPSIDLVKYQRALGAPFLTSFARSGGFDSAGADTFALFSQ